MDVFFKRYFWVVNLLGIGLCAVLAGRATSHLAEQFFLLGDDSAPPARRSLLSQAEKTRSKDIAEIVKRNVFCSACTPIVPTAEASAGGGSGPASNEPVKSSLQLELVSTMVVPSDERWSMAVIRDLASKEKDPALYARGSRLPGGSGAVLRVIERKVYLKANGRVEYLELEGAAPPPAASTAVAVAGADNLDEQIGSRVHCTGNACEIERGLVDSLLSNTAGLATAARFVPSIRDGRPNGFKLYAIRPSSIFGRLGMQNGDTIKAINGMEMTSPDQALGVYTKLRTASHLTVSVERRGETQTLDYTIR